MFVQQMTVDMWQNRADHGAIVENPTWEQVAEAIAQLDGDNRTLVTLSDSAGSDRCIIVAGQWDDRFIVNGTPGNHDFYSLIDTSRSDDKRILFVGGQNGDYRESQCVPMGWAVQAARTYFETGALDSALNWISDY